ncbi:MAG: hypothetical protein RJB13_861 [Pseudomonadota bacterium]
MNYNHLYYFHCIATAGSITAAAKALNISQPTLSAQLKEFEKSISAPLFIRTGRILELTAVGRKIFAISSQMFLFASKIHAIAVAPHAGTDSTIKVGVSDEVEFPFISELMAEHITNEHSGASETVHLIRCNNEDAQVNLANGNLDFVFSASIPSETPQFLVKTFELPVHIIAQYGSLSSTFRRVTDYSSSEFSRILDALPVDLVLPSQGFTLRNEIDSYLARRLIRKHCRLESSSLSSIIRVVAEGVGFSFLPSLYAEDAMRLKRVHCIGPKSGFWKSCLAVTAQDSPRNKTIIKNIGKKILSFQPKIA